MKAHAEHAAGETGLRPAPRDVRSARERRIHLFYLISLALKALHAVFELGSGVFLLVVSTAALSRWLTHLTRGELREDPHDLVARYLYGVGQNLSAGGQQFGALYLLTHGAINLGLVAGLVKEKLWAYPAALGALWAFVGYQIYRYLHTHAPGLVALTALDLVVIALVWHEYRYVRRRRAARRGE